MTWRRKLDRQPDRVPELPYWPYELSNGEFVPRPPTAQQRSMVDEILRRCADAAERRGMNRRRFLTQAGAVAATLGVLNGCASGGDPAVAPVPTATSPPPHPTPTPLPPAPTSTPVPEPTPTEGPGGQYDEVDPADEEACEAVLGGDEFIFDVHTHHVVPDGPWRQAAPAIAAMVARLVPPGCIEADPFTCLDRVAYVSDMFLASDTTMALVSDVPNGGDADAPLPFDDKLVTADLVDTLTTGGASRVLVHDVIAPNFGVLQDRLDLMTARAQNGRLAAYKAYTAWGPDGRGYALDDPAIGLPVVERVLDSGVNVLCAHKGLPILGFDPAFNGPRDLVALAAQFPQLQVVVYHSAFERATYEGPYDPAAAVTGTNSLLRALDDHGVPPNANVWCELGTTWRELMRDPTQAAHMLGKLLSRVGEDRVMWGTDAIWLGSPQAQIMAFRAFDITPEFQDVHGYPQLTRAIKEKVLGLNAAALFGVDPVATRCAVDGDALTAAAPEYRALVAEGAVASPYRSRGPVTRRDLLTGLRADPRLLGPD